MLFSSWEQWLDLQIFQLLLNFFPGSLKFFISWASNETTDCKFASFWKLVFSNANSVIYEIALVYKYNIMLQMPKNYFQVGFLNDVAYAVNSPNANWKSNKQESAKIFQYVKCI